LGVPSSQLGNEWEYAVGQDDLNGKVAIVTGAAFGLGRATAIELARRGANVIIGDIDQDNGQKVAQDIGAKASFRLLDVADEKSWIQTTEYAQDELGGFHILVNNAANPSRLTPIEEATYEEWLEVFKVNSAGVFLGCKHAVISMKKNGGAIVNVSSQSAVIGMRATPLYASSKGSINALTRAVAAHCRLGGLPIRCNTVMPGRIKTKMARDGILRLTGIDIDGHTPEALELVKSFATPESVAAVIVFLASPDAARVNGAEILVDDAESLTYQA
jgi:3(or 17)beta-hydroxysteroid dehydrogenase